MMSGLKNFGGFVGRVHIQTQRNQVFLINTASTIALKSGSVDVQVGM